MYELTVRTDFAAAHALRGYDGKCSRLHGHGFKLDISVRGERLNSLGMLMDFVVLKRHVHDVLEALDHTSLNDLEPFARINPTAENIARYVSGDLQERLPEGVAVASVTVHETDRAAATYLPGPGGERLPEGAPDAL